MLSTTGTNSSCPSPFLPSFIKSYPPPYFSPQRFIMYKRKLLKWKPNNITWDWNANIWEDSSHKYRPKLSQNINDYLKAAASRSASAKDVWGLRGLSDLCLPLGLPLPFPTELNPAPESKLWLV